MRASRPEVAVDTGVLYGASTAHILAAMADNGTGELHSIDIGRDRREPPHDFFIPAHLQPRWELTIGDSRDELPRVLQRCGNIDLFYHDSLHTWEHMLWEYGTALPYLTERGYWRRTMSRMRRVFADCSGRTRSLVSVTYGESYTQHSII